MTPSSCLHSDNITWTTLIKVVSESFRSIHSPKSLIEALLFLCISKFSLLFWPWKNAIISNLHSLRMLLQASTKPQLEPCCLFLYLDKENLYHMKYKQIIFSFRVSYCLTLAVTDCSRLCHLMKRWPNIFMLCFFLLLLLFSSSFFLNLCIILLWATKLL